MERVSLSQFTDFMMTTGVARARMVAEVKDHRHDVLNDFYKRLRESIVYMHQEGHADVLDQVVPGLADDRKKRIFPDLIAGYRRFLAAQPLEWFAPPAAVLEVGDLGVNINPELGFEIAGVPHLVKLYFRGDPLAQKRVNLTLGLVSAALAEAHPGTVFSMLDVKNARLHTLKAAPSAKLPALVRGEAAAFLSMYGAV